MVQIFFELYHFAVVTLMAYKAKNCNFIQVYWTHQVRSHTDIFRLCSQNLKCG